MFCQRIVFAALAAVFVSGSAHAATCASEDKLKSDWQASTACAKALVAEAKARADQGDKAGAKAAYLRAKQVNGYAGIYGLIQGNLINDALAALSPAPATKTAAAAAPVGKGGAIPSGDYQCFTATTGRVLAGGGGILVPGSLVGRIRIRGGAYQVNDGSTGRYSVGRNGVITWIGGEYSSKTLGRVVQQHGAPAIAIGYADTDAGSICQK